MTWIGLSSYCALLLLSMLLQIVARLSALPCSCLLLIATDEPTDPACAAPSAAVGNHPRPFRTHVPMARHRSTQGWKSTLTKAREVTSAVAYRASSAHADAITRRAVSLFAAPGAGWLIHCGSLPRSSFIANQAPARLVATSVMLTPGTRRPSRRGRMSDDARAWVRTPCTSWHPRCHTPAAQVVRPNAPSGIDNRARELRVFLSERPGMDL